MLSKSFNAELELSQEIFFEKLEICHLILLQLNSSHLPLFKRFMTKLNEAMNANFLEAWVPKRSAWQEAQWYQQNIKKLSKIALLIGHYQGKLI